MTKARSTASPVFLLAVLALVLTLVPASTRSLTSHQATLGSSMLVADTTPAAPETALQKTVDAMRPGYNMAASFDSIGSGGTVDETYWGQPKVTRELFKQLKLQGFNSVRLPVSWLEHTGPAPDYTIDPAYLARIKQVVGWAIAEGLYIIVDMHHDSSEWVINMPTDHDAVLAKFKASWTQIAAAFTKTSTKLFFESLNEPRFSDDWSADSDAFFGYLNELNTTFHTVVRASGGKNATRPLLLPTITSSATQPRLDALSTTITALHDPNLIATVHYYGEFHFSVASAGNTRFDGAVKQDLIDTLDRAYTTFTAHGVPVIIGEIGQLAPDDDLARTNHGELMKYYEFLQYYSGVKHMLTMLWDDWFYNRFTYTWRDQLIGDTVIGGAKHRSSTADNDSLFVTKGSTPKAASLALDLNGNTFRKISWEDRTLKAGTDYTLTGSTLTLSASFLAEATHSSSYGVNAVLTLRFSQGADWQVKVIVIDQPTVQAGTGTTAAFAVPTTFNGDVLSTMTATYPDGTWPNPDNWTKYKPWADAFKPDYATGQIVLTPSFLAGLNDGTTTLEFGFWSGAKVGYTLTKTGTDITGAVTGAPSSSPSPTPTAEDSTAAVAS